LLHLFSTPIWQTFNIKELSIWCDNGPHFRTKILLSVLSDLTRNKEFKGIALCFFEAYHGKSEVDSMFGTMTNWITQWTKTRFINTTKDLLDCFLFNNSFLPFPNQNFFYYLSFSESLWTKSKHLGMKGKIRDLHYFYFNSKYTESFTTYRYTFISNRTTTNEIECTRLREDVRIVKKDDPKKFKKPPKYSKDIEAVNSTNLTAADEKLLQKKAKT